MYLADTFNNLLRYFCSFADAIHLAKLAELLLTKICNNNKDLKTNNARITICDLRDPGDPLITSTFSCVRFVNVAYFFPCHNTTTQFQKKYKPGEKEEEAQPEKEKERRAGEKREAVRKQECNCRAGRSCARVRKGMRRRIRNGAHEKECSSRSRSSSSGSSGSLPCHKKTIREDNAIQAGDSDQLGEKEERERELSFPSRCHRHQTIDVWTRIF